MEKISYPPELDRHDIPQQQHAKLQKSASPEELAAIEESNIIRRQLKWMIPHVVNLHNMMTESPTSDDIHDLKREISALKLEIAQLKQDSEFLRRLKWLAGLLVSLAAFIHIILQIGKALPR
jgi:hypothetical protein